MLRITSIMHWPDAAAAAAAGGSGSGAQQQQLQNVAKLVPGTELHIAPKPRVLAGGGALNPGQLPLANGSAGTGAGADHNNNKQQQQQAGQRSAGSADGGHAQQQQQQQEPREAVWLRVQDAGSKHLLDTADLQSQQQPSTGQPSAASNSSSDNSSKHEAVVKAVGDHQVAAAVTGDISGMSGSSSSSIPVLTGPVCASWVTTAVYVSHATAKDLNLQPGELVRIHQGNSSSSSSSSSSTSSSVLPLQSLVLLLLLDDDVAWGHVAVAPPLQQALAVAVHHYVKLQPLPQAQQLQQLPGLVIHPLLPAVNGSTTAAAAAGTAAVGSSSMAALAAGLGDAAAAAAARLGNSSSSSGTTMQADRTARASISEIEELPYDASAGDATPQQQQQQQQQQPLQRRRQQRRWKSEPTSRQQQQQQQQDSFTGLGLLQEEVNRMLVRPLQLLTRLTESSDKPAAANMTSAQQHAHQAKSVQTAAAAAAAARIDAAAALSALLQPGVVSAAVHAWLRLQLQAVAAAAAADGAAGACEASLACCGPMLVHFRLQQQQQQLGDVASMQQQGPLQSQDHLLLLVAHHNRQGDTAPSATSSSSSYMLPASLLLGNKSSTSTQQQQLNIHVAGALVNDPAAAAVAHSAAAVQHNAHVSLISSTSSSSSSSSSTPRTFATAHHKQQQQQQQLGQTPGSTLNPADFPWLNPALESCLARLIPRLGLQSWRAWQSAELPLPGGVLVVGGSDGGRDWLLQLMGQAAAQQHSAHILKVRAGFWVSGGVGGRTSYSSKCCRCLAEILLVSVC
jgi:hypothetical protein